MEKSSMDYLANFIGNNLYLFDPSEKKDKHITITVHTDTDENMDKLLSILEEDLGEKINNVKKKMMYVKRKDLFHEKGKTIQKLNLLDYTMSEELLQSPSFKLHYKIISQPLIDSFMTKLGNPKICNRSFWYPKRLECLDTTSVRKTWNSEEQHIPKYPIYIISKGRWECRHTQRALEEMKVPYKIVVEPQEYDNYAENIPKDNILILPNEYLNKNQGSIPVRNFIMKHSKEQGFERHWCLDDNIKGYFRNQNSIRLPIKNGAVFTMIEDYVDCFENVKMAGHNYTCFNNYDMKRVIMNNTRVYSSILLSNDTEEILGEGWRGRYNEDTDLSIRFLKKGYPTMLFNNLLANKLKTMSCKGGNTDTIYSGEDAHYQKALHLKEQHPKITKIVKKFTNAKGQKRWHHDVDYTPFFGNEPILKPNLPQFTDYDLKLI